MYNVIVGNSWPLNSPLWFTFIFLTAAAMIGWILRTNMQKLADQEKNPPAEKPTFWKSPKVELIGWSLVLIFDIIMMSSRLYAARDLIKQNDPLQCDLWKTPVVRMVSTMQWSRNQEGVTFTGCNLNPNLKVVIEQHVKGAATINPSVPSQVLNENQIVVHVNKINWQGFQDGEIVVSIIDPNKSPSWRGSIAELRAGQIGGGRQLVTLSTRD